MTQNIRPLTLIFLFVFFLACSSQKSSNSSTPLIEAVKSGDLVRVQDLVSDGTDIDARDDTGQSALHHACFLGYYEIVRELVESGADVNIMVPVRRLTPLHAATMNGDIDIVTFLVDQGAEVNSADDEGGTPILAACWMGQLPVVEFLVGKGADIHARTNYGSCLLHAATNSGNFELVRYLVEKGIDVNARADNGAAALHIAAAIGSKEIVAFLLENNARVDVRLNTDFAFSRVINAPIRSGDDIVEVRVDSNQTPLDIARSKGFDELVEMLENHDRASSGPP